MKGKFIRTEIERHTYSNKEAGHEIVGFFRVDGTERDIRVSFGDFERRYSAKWNRIIGLYGEILGPVDFVFEKNGDKISLSEDDKKAITDLIYKENYLYYLNLRLVFKNTKEEDISIDKLRKIMEKDMDKEMEKRFGIRMC